jgi:hypothetical protein
LRVSWSTTARQHSFSLDRISSRSSPKPPTTPCNRNAHSALHRPDHAIRNLPSGRLRVVETDRTYVDDRNQAEAWFCTARGAVGFLRNPGIRNGVIGPDASVPADIKAPILALQAGADQNITAPDNAQFREAPRGGRRGARGRRLRTAQPHRLLRTASSRRFAEASDGALAPNALAFIDPAKNGRGKATRFAASSWLQGVAPFVTWEGAWLSRRRRPVDGARGARR